MRTASEMGIRTVAVFVEADARSPHIDDADDAVLLAGRVVPRRRSGDRRSARVGSRRHPSRLRLPVRERRLRRGGDRGGPHLGRSGPEAIAAMGDKLAAKRLAVEAGVPTLPSARTRPRLLASAGPAARQGPRRAAGGKGMRIVERAEDLADAVAAARREALGGFGDDTVFPRALRRPLTATSRSRSSGTATATSCTSESVSAPSSAATRRWSRRRRRRWSTPPCGPRMGEAALAIAPPPRVPLGGDRRVPRRRRAGRTAAALLVPGGQHALRWSTR